VNTAGARAEAGRCHQLAAAQAEAERQRQENEALKKKSPRRKPAQNLQCPQRELRPRCRTGHSHGVSLFPTSRSSISAPFRKTRSSLTAPFPKREGGFSLAIRLRSHPASFETRRRCALLRTRKSGMAERCSSS